MSENCFLFFRFFKISFQCWCRFSVNCITRQLHDHFFDLDQRQSLVALGKQATVSSFKLIIIQTCSEFHQVEVVTGLTTISLQWEWISHFYALYGVMYDWNINVIYIIAHISYFEILDNIQQNIYYMFYFSSNHPFIHLSHCYWIGKI